jgi:hypothetical protein
MRENIVLQSELFRLRTDCSNMTEKILIHKYLKSILAIIVEYAWIYFDVFLFNII